MSFSAGLRQIFRSGIKFRQISTPASTVIRRNIFKCAPIVRYVSIPQPCRLVSTTPYVSGTTHAVSYGSPKSNGNWYGGIIIVTGICLVIFYNMDAVIDFWQYRRPRCRTHKATPATPVQVMHEIPTSTTPHEIPTSPTNIPTPPLTPDTEELLSPASDDWVHL